MCPHIWVLVETRQLKQQPLYMKSCKRKWLVGESPPRHGGDSPHYHVGNPQRKYPAITSSSSQTHRPCKGHWSQTSRSLVTFAKVSTEQTAVMDTWATCERAFTKWKSRNSKRANALCVHFLTSFSSVLLGLGWILSRLHCHLSYDLLCFLSAMKWMVW